MQLLKLFHIIDANPEYLWVISVKKWWGSNWHLHTALCDCCHPHLIVNFTLLNTIIFFFCTGNLPSHMVPSAGCMPLEFPIQRGIPSSSLSLPAPSQSKLKTLKYIFETMMLNQAFNPKQWCFCSVYSIFEQVHNHGQLSGNSAISRV